MAIAYGVIFALTLFMPALYFTSVRKKQSELWLFFLFVCVSIVTLGYHLISISKTVKFALFANKIAYMGQVFVPMCMFMLISKLCGFTYKKWLYGVLIGLAALMFAIVCTTGHLNWYYTNVTLAYADGATYLVKEYGVLHPTNLIYVVSYFAAMLVVIGISLAKHKNASQKMAAFMLVIVLGNIGMWIVEKIITWTFELLAISYLMSVCAFYFVYILLQDYIPIHAAQPSVIVVDSLSRAEKIEGILAALPEGITLSARQMDVLEGILDGKSRKAIAADLCLSENTVKMHTSALYRLLNVSSRDEIFALLKV